MTDLVTGKPLEQALAVQQEFLTLMQSKGVQADVDDDLLEDAVAFAGVSRYPARIKCALLGWMAFKDAAAQAVAAKEMA
jgi:nitrogen fixation NifU-like protein